MHVNVCELTVQSAGICKNLSLVIFFPEICRRKGCAESINELFETDFDENFVLNFWSKRLHAMSNKFCLAYKNKMFLEVCEFDFDRKVFAWSVCVCLNDVSTDDNLLILMFRLH